MSRTKSDAVLEADRQIGQCLGAGMSVEKAAEHIGVHSNTVRNHIDLNKHFIFKVKAEVEAIFAKTLAHEIEDLETKYKRIRPKAWEKIETLIDSKQEGIALGASNSALDRIDGKAVNKTLILGQFDHEHSHSLSDETLARLEALQNKMLPKAVLELPSGSAERD